MPSNSETLDKSLGLLDVYAIATGATLSSGFFLLPGLAAVEAGSGLVLAYLLAVIPLVPAMLSKVELMTAMPRAGGIYFFLDRSLGPLAGTVGGLGTWLVLILKVAFALVGMGAYLAVFFPELNITPVAVGLAAVIGVVNLYGAKISGTVQVWLVAGILLVLAFFLATGLPRVEASNFQGMLDAGTSGLLSTAGLVYVSYAGLTKVAGVAEEVREPERTLPLGVFLAVGSAVLIYGLGTAVIVGVVPMEELRGSMTSVSQAATAAVGPWAGIALAVAALLAFVAVTNAGTLSASRYPLAMSRDRILPPFFDRLNRWGIPGRSVLATVGLIVASILFFDPTKIAKLASSFQLLVFALVCLAVIVMRESRIEEYDPGYSAPWYPWLQIVGMVAPAVLILEMGLWSSLFSLGLVLTGVIWYWQFVREDAEREGAIYHLFDRLGDQRYDGLEHELREILQEKGLREADPYGEMLGRSQVAEIDGPASFEDVVREASRRMARALPADADELTDTFLEETELGVTPVSHGAALPHVRLEGVDTPYLLLVRSREGLEIEEEGDRADSAAGDGGSGASGAEQVHAIFFLVSPESDPRQHLRMLAKLADHVQDADFLEEWLAADDPQDLKEVMLRDERIVTLHVERDRATSELIGRPVRHVELSGEIVATLIERGAAVVEPEAETILEEGDCVTLLGTPRGIRAVRERFRG